MNLFRRKLPQADEREGLKRCLSATDLTFLGIGNMIGTGIFVLTGVAAATQAGPAIILSFIVAGIACAFVAFAYAELAASVGGCGGAYGYAYAAFGELPAWIIGWNLAFGLGTACAAVANGWSGYFNNALAAMGVSLPGALTKGPAAGGLINVPAMGVILLLMFALFAGVKQSAKLNRLIVFAKLAAIGLFIAVAVFHVNTALLHPFLPYGWFRYQPDGRTVGVLAAASLVFFAYRGFQNVSIAVEEANNPQRDMPIGILGSLAVCTVIYLTVAGLLTAIAPYNVLNVSSPVAFALLRLGYNWGSALVAVGVIIGLTSTMLVLYYALTRLLFAVARDGLLPPFFSALDPKTHTPANAIVLAGVVMALAAGLVPLGALAELVNAGTLAEFMLVSIGVIVLRLMRPSMRRPFKVPGGMIIPVLAVLSCGALLGFLPLVSLERFAIYLAAGLAVYFLYAARHSRTAPPNIPDEIAAE
jgi:APA family basic amino acid/polyamine antiporter